MTPNGELATHGSAANRTELFRHSESSFPRAVVIDPTGVADPFAELSKRRSEPTRESSGYDSHRVVESAPLAELPVLAREHLKLYPFRAPHNVATARFWYEGTYDPMGPHHVEILKEVLSLGFERGVLAICHQNPVKTQSTPFALRVQMARELLRAEGIPIAASIDAPGVFIPTSEDQFHHRKHVGWYDAQHYLIMGPDNFASYYDADGGRGVNWFHPKQLRENADAAHFGNFRRLYDEVAGFAARVLVYPRLHEIHATDIRNGSTRPHPVVEKFIAEHGLYGSRTPAPIETTQVAPKVAVQEQNLSRTEFDSKQLQRALAEQLAQTALTALAERGFERPQVGHAVRRASNCMDVSQLHEALECLQPRQADGPRSEGVGRPSEGLRMLRDSLLDALIGRNLEVEGIGHVLQAQLQRQRIVFVGNHSGPADVALLPYALRREGASAIADKVCCLVDPQIFSSPFERAVFGRAVALVQEGEVLASEGQAARNLEHESRPEGLRQGASIVLFPQRSAHTSLAAFRAQVTEMLNPENLAKLLGSADNVAIVPFAQSGTEQLRSGQAGPVSDEFPVRVSFGRAIPAKEFFVRHHTEDPETRAHILGHLVAGLLPSDSQGVYGPGKASHLRRGDPRMSIEPTSLARINWAEVLSGRAQQ